jgi:hypothetical protein
LTRLESTAKARRVAGGLDAAEGYAGEIVETSK